MAAYTRDEILDVVQDLHQIPHLKLPFKFDVARLQSETAVIDKWTSHSHAGFKDMSEEQMRRFSKGYSGVSLYEFNGVQDYATDNYEIFVGNEPSAKVDPATGQILFFPTPLVEKMPYTHSVVETISERKGRTRIMRSEPDHAIVWHSHNRGPWFNPFMLEAIVHVPIKTEKKVLHAVRDYRDPRAQAEKFSRSHFEKLTQDSQTFVQNYEEGDCWIFNSWHDHYYHNYSSSVRYTLLMYIRWFFNDDFVDLVRGTLADYQGPRLSN